MKYALLNIRRRVVEVSDAPIEKKLPFQTPLEIPEDVYSQLSSVDLGVTPMFLLEGGGISETAPEVSSPTQPVVPKVVPVWRIRVAAVSAGLFDTIENSIAGLPEPARSVANEVWERGNTISRDSDIVAALIQSSDLSEQDVDTLFISASQIPS